MTTENARRGRSISPSSGRDSPAPGRRPIRRPLEENTGKHDKSYRRYASNIERTLATFDASLEWPDYISFLGRLLKTIQGSPSDCNTLPHSQAVAHRLAQCLNPTLPSGVHQKALELYGHIFSLIGREGVAHDLPKFLPGLSPVLTFASLSLRPTYLSLIENHIVKVDGAFLRPALRALILCLLPGLEEEVSDEFERTMTIMDLLKDSVGSSQDTASASQGFRDDHFWQCLFLAAVGSKSRRQGALAYLVKRLPSLAPISSSGELMNMSAVLLDPSSVCLPAIAEPVISPEPGLLIRCFVTGLEDDQQLVQRGYLDLLISHLPLSSAAFRDRVTRPDLERLVMAAVNVVARRDMSLNRRLWSWFLGSASGEANEEIASPTDDAVTTTGSNVQRSKSYFELFGLGPLTQSVLTMIRRTGTSIVAQARPFRVCLSLMDRQEIGAHLISEIFEPAMEQLMKYQKMSTTADFQEVLKSANSFFDGVESGTIWAELTRLLHQSFVGSNKDASDLGAKLELVDFIVVHFNIREEEMLAFHIPLFSASLIMLVSQIELKSEAISARENKLCTQALNLLEKLIAIMPERVSLNDSFAANEEMSTSHARAIISSEKVIARIIDFYQTTRGNLSLAPPPFSSKRTAEILLFSSSQILSQSLHRDMKSSQRELRCNIFAGLLAKVPDTSAIETKQVLDSMLNSISENFVNPHQRQFPIYSAITDVLVCLMSRPGLDVDPAMYSSLQAIVHRLIRELWDFLTPTYPRHHVEAVKCIWQLNDLIANDCSVEAAVSGFLVTDTETSLGVLTRTESARRFSVLWNHTVPLPGVGPKKTPVRSSRASVMSQSKSTLDVSQHQEMLQRPLLLLLEGLYDLDTELAYFLRAWLQFLPSIGSIVTFLVGQAHTAQTHLPTISVGVQAKARLKQQQHEDSSGNCIYFLRHLQNVLRLSSDSIWTAFSVAAELQAVDKDEKDPTRLDVQLANICHDILKQNARAVPRSETSNALKRVALAILAQLLRGPNSRHLKALRLEDTLIEALGQELKDPKADCSVHVAMLDVIGLSLQLRLTINAPVDSKSDSTSPPESMAQSGPPPELITCIQEGISLKVSQSVLEHWVRFLVDIMPMYAESLFQNIIPLVEAFCTEITKKFGSIRAVFHQTLPVDSASSEVAVIALLEGLEHVLAAAHDRLDYEERKATAAKSPEPTQSFFGNVVSGVFNTESQKNRGAVANTRLTVLLCFQDAVRICYSIWLWGQHDGNGKSHDASSASTFAYVSGRMRHKARRMLDRMFAVEPLECLETVVVEWINQSEQETRNSLAITLLHALSNSRPKAMMPALFNSLYSRTNPSALEASRSSSLTSEIFVIDLGHFLVEYTRSLDDDAMDEVWQDCMAFLRDVVANPLPHSPVLPLLLNFTLILAQKVENTNFGDSRKMRRELSDLFMRMLTATFTTRPGAGLLEPVPHPMDGKTAINSNGTAAKTRKTKPVDLYEVLNTVVPQLSVVVVEPERMSSAAAIISTSAISPVIHSKSFPASLRASNLELLSNLTRLPSASRAWRKELSDLFQHPRLFSAQPDLAENYLLPVIRQSTLSDKDRLPDLLSRIPAPTSAGIVFGVGATAARMEADKKSQLNLRRAALVILAMDDDYVVAQWAQVEAKVTELLNATPSSSPSSTTRAEALMLLRSVILKTSTTHLTSAWPLITSELQRALGSILPKTAEYETYNVASLLQACKLLDLLLVTAPDDFQLYEWLFVTDTIDAVYRPTDYEAIGLADELAEELGASTSAGAQTPITPMGEINFGEGPGQGRRRGLLEEMLKGQGRATEMSKEEVVSRVIRPWLSQLSMHTYEGTYSLRAADWASGQRSLLEDLFNDATIVG